MGLYDICASCHEKMAYRMRIESKWVRSKPFKCENLLKDRDGTFMDCVVRQDIKKFAEDKEKGEIRCSKWGSMCPLEYHYESYHNKKEKE